MQFCYMRLYVIFVLSQNIQIIHFYSEGDLMNTDLVVLGFIILLSTILYLPGKLILKKKKDSKIINIEDYKKSKINKELP